MKGMSICGVSAICAMLLQQPAFGQEGGIFSIADDIKARNDCTDQSNQECRSMFENTCSWVGSSSVVIRDGLMQSIPEERIGNRIFGELVEIAEGSGGNVDLPLAESFVEPIWQYFVTGQYDAEFAHYSSEAGIVYGMMLGGAMTGQSAEADKYVQQLTERINQALAQKWHDTCMQTAYVW